MNVNPKPEGLHSETIPGKEYKERRNRNKGFEGQPMNEGLTQNYE